MGRRRDHAENARHRRTLRVDHTASTIVLNDDLRSADATPHAWSQLFHVHPALDVSRVNDNEVLIVDQAGNRLRIKQGSAVSLKLRSGNVDGEPTSFFSPKYGDLSPNHALVFRSRTPTTRFVFTTELAFE